MNRVIKFRAWVNGKGMFYFTIDELLRSTVHSDGHTYAGGDMDYVWRDGDKMQFTGLLDKNGKEIYEGDVLKWKGARYWKERNPDAGKVVWAHEGYPSFSVINDYDNSSYSLLLGGKNPQETFEIIGNVYESPDLLTNNRSMP